MEYQSIYFYNVEGQDGRVKKDGIFSAATRRRLVRYYYRNETIPDAIAIRKGLIIESLARATSIETNI
jgi:hypothetical protein